MRHGNLPFRRGKRKVVCGRQKQRNSLRMPPFISPESVKALNEVMCVTNDNWTPTVSYTHLDVYKRQEYEDIVSGTGRLNKDIYAKQSIKSGIAFHQGDVPVSYTHLDVYKRQSIYSVLIPLESNPVSIWSTTMSRSICFSGSFAILS